MESKGQFQFDCRAVCNAQKTMPVRLFNSIFFAYYSLSFFSVRFTQQIENPSIIRVMIHQPASAFKKKKKKKKLKIQLPLKLNLKLNLKLKLKSRQ